MNLEIRGADEGFLMRLLFTGLGARYVFALRVTQALLFLLCVALRVKTHLAPSGVNEWGLRNEAAVALIMLKSF